MFEPPDDIREIVPFAFRTSDYQLIDSLDREAVERFLRQFKSDFMVMRRLREESGTHARLLTDDEVISTIATRLITGELVLPRRERRTAAAGGGSGGSRREAPGALGKAANVPAAGGLHAPPPPPPPPHAPPPGRLRVLVTDEKGNGVAHIPVTGPGAKNTDGSGTALYDPLGPGHYTVRIVTPLPDPVKQDFFLPAAHATHPAQVPSGGAAEVDFQLKRRPWPTIKVDAPKIVLVKHDYQGKPKPGVKPHRIPVVLSYEGDHDGVGELTCDHADHIAVFEKQDDPEAKAKGLPWDIKAAELKNKTVFVEGLKPSASMSDTELKLTLKNGTVPPRTNAPNTNPATEKITCVLLELDIYKWRPEDGSDPVKIAEGPKIEPGRAVLVQGTTDARLWAQRAKMVLIKAKPHDYAGKLVLKPINASVQVFDAAQEKPAPGQAALAALTFPNTGIDAAAGKTFWVQGKTVSGAMGDTGWTVELEELPNHEGDRVTMTVIQAELALFQSRTDVPANIPLPTAFSDADKFSAGRFIHIQDPGFQHGRAMVLVKKVKPDGFTGKLVLTAYDATQTPSYSATKSGAPKIKLFEQEVAAHGQAAKALPLEIDHPAAYPAAGKAFWVEGSTVSAALRDAELRLGIEEVDTGNDRVEFTVVRFKNFKADVPSTAPQTKRAGPLAQGAAPIANNPVPRHDFKTAQGALDKKDFSESFTENKPLVLVEDSILDAVNDNKLFLTVEVEPAGVKIGWSVQRDTRPAPDGDAPAVIALSPNPVPTVTQDGGNQLKATLKANAAGSFHVRPFVDCNGTNKFEHNNAAGARIDREPFLIMNLVLIHAEGFQDNGLAQPANIRIFPPAAQTNANFGGISTASGHPWTGANTGWHGDATILVVGGGRDGKRGLDKLFAGWIQTLHLLNIGSTYQVAAPAPAPPVGGGPAPPAPPPVNHFHKMFFVSNSPGPPGGFFYVPGGMFGGPGKPPMPANSGTGPAVIPAPLLDCTNFANAGTGGNLAVGTEGAIGPPKPIVKTAAPGGGPGQHWRVEMWDGPGIGCRSQHQAFGGILTEFHFNLGFRSDLCLWTNVSGAAGNTPEAACRLYSSVVTVGWNTVFTIVFNAVTGAGAITNAANVTRTPVAANRKATPVEGSGLEPRFPVALLCYAVDAQT